MSIEKERNAFQKFCEENFDFEHHEHTYFDEQTQSYENDLGECTESINMAWMAWQASANREGYKLVPIQPDNKTIVSIERMVENQIEASGINQDPFRLDGENIYKAMIGAIE